MQSAEGKNRHIVAIKKNFAKAKKEKSINDAARRRRSACRSSTHHTSNNNRLSGDSFTYDHTFSIYLSIYLSMYLTMHQYLAANNCKLDWTVH
jgi:hypothetical protein